MRDLAYEPAHCIVCGHADSQVVSEADAIRREVEELWAFHEKRLAAGTPVERLRDRVAFSQHPPFRLVACSECGLVYRNPTERAFEVESTYARDCPPRAMLQALHDGQRHSYRAQARRLRKILRPGATVLEVGSYVGAFLSVARDAGLDASGIDINPAVNAFTRSLGFDVRDGELSDAGEDMVDAIAIWNTFDQLADPRAALTAAATRLRPGGILAIRVPNGAFYRKWSSNRRLGTMLLAHNNLLTFPYRWGFTPYALSKLVREIGFDVARMVGDVLVPTADEYTRRWASLEERAVKALVRLRERSHAERAPWFELYAIRR